MLSYQVVILPQAEQDLQSLNEYFADRSPSTLTKLDSELRMVESQLTEFPYSYQSTSDSEFRRAFLNSCRFTVYFSINALAVEIYAILPQKAGPKLIEDRGLVWQPRRS